MLRFLVKGLLRDRSRSFFPVLVCGAGVFLVFVGGCFIDGVVENFIHASATFATGHVKVVSWAASRENGGAALELALATPPAFFTELREMYPGWRWTRRCTFGGLLDVPDERGETRAQSPVACMSMDLLSDGSVEARELNLARTLTAGRLPASRNEILVSTHLAERLSLSLDETATLLASTRDGAQTAVNYTVVGFIRLGIPMLDRSTVLMDVSGADDLLDMEGSSAEILGYRRSGFAREAVEGLARSFNAAHGGSDEYRPHMLTLMDQNNLRSFLDTTSGVAGIWAGLFVLLMTLVLWSAGLVSGIRRFSEVGLRLALGERRRHIVGSMLAESLATGVVGTLGGVLLGLPLALYFQDVGLDYSDTMKDFSMMMTGVLKAKVSWRPLLFAAVPGLTASFVGMAMASLAIYQRKTASLFKELET